MRPTCNAAFSSSSIFTCPVKGPLSLRSPAAQLATATDDEKSREEEWEQGEWAIEGDQGDQRGEEDKEQVEWIGGGNGREASPCRKGKRDNQCNEQEKSSKNGQHLCLCQPLHSGPHKEQHP